MVFLSSRKTFSLNKIGIDILILTSFLLETSRIDFGEGVVSLYTIIWDRYLLQLQIKKKDARFSKMKNMPDLLSDDRKGKIIENIDSKYLRNRASFLRKPVFLTYHS